MTYYAFVVQSNKKLCSTFLNQDDGFVLQFLYIQFDKKGPYHICQAKVLVI